MSKIEAKIVEDSKNEFGNRITTMVVTFPRIILAEFNTHRMFSRNSASSRAIPFAKMVQSVRDNPFIPIAWQKDHKGMQGTEYFTTNDFVEGYEGKYNMVDYCNNLWQSAKEAAIGEATELNKVAKVTKQLANRLLEPFMWHTVIVTATEWENFFALRCPRYHFNEEGPFRSKVDLLKKYTDSNMDYATDLQWLKCNKGQAEIHMMALAEAMWDAMNESTPKLLKAGEWHIPFGEGITMESITELAERSPKEGKEEIVKLLAKPLMNALFEMNPEGLTKIKVKVATARCARISYTVVGEEDKKDNYENDIKLHDRLKESGHMSPFEHCAKAMDTNLSSGNFTGGWMQYRKMIPNENII